MKIEKCCICKKEESEYEIETPNFIFDVYHVMQKNFQRILKKFVIV